MSTDIELAQTPPQRLAKKRKPDYVAIGQDPQIHWLAIMLRIANETESYLCRLERLVREGKAVEEASNYCRWLQFSGICSLPRKEFPAVRQHCDRLQEAINEIYTTGKHTPQYQTTDIEDIKRKLDALLRNSPKPVTVDVDSTAFKEAV